jgi:hypothetical protein
MYFRLRGKNPFISEYAKLAGRLDVERAMLARGARPETA